MLKILWMNKKDLDKWTEILYSKTTRPNIIMMPIPGWVQWLTPVIPECWEVEVGHMA